MEIIFQINLGVNISTVQIFEKNFNKAGMNAIFIETRNVFLCFDEGNLNSPLFSLFLVLLFKTLFGSFTGSKRRKITPSPILIKNSTTKLIKLLKIYIIKPRGRGPPQYETSARQGRK